MRGGYSHVGLDCGTFYIRIAIGSGGSIWYYGAELLTTYAIRGGRSTDGAYCGIFCISIDSSSADTGWRRGALLHMLCVVVFLMVVSLMEPFLLVLVIFIMLLIGVMALIHHYAIRGGRSSNNLNDGLYCMSITYTGSYYSLGFGAVYNHYICCSWRSF